MKFKGLLAALGLLVLVGCGSEEEKQREHERQMACIEATGDRYCRGDRDEPQVVYNIEIEYEYDDVEYGPSGPGTYTNYYGSPKHGYWDDGEYKFYDPYGSEASSTNAFLLGAGLGGLVGYKMSQSQWKKKHPGGWKKTTRKNDRILSKNGEVLTKAEYDRRKAQSAKDKARHAKKLKEKRVAAQKAKQAKINKEKAAKKPSAAQQSALKEKLQAKQDKRKADAAKKPKKVIPGAKPPKTGGYTPKKPNKPKAKSGGGYTPKKQQPRPKKVNNSRPKSKKR